MQFFTAWREEFVKFFVWVGAIATRWDKVKIVLAWIVLICPAAATVASNWVSWIPDWSFYLLLLPVAYISVAAGWSAAIARQKTMGPIIQISEPYYNDAMRMFQVDVKNAGNGQVDAYVFAVRVQDKAGTILSRIAQDLPLLWAGYDEPNFMLFGERHGVAGIMNVWSATRSDEAQIASLSLILNILSLGRTEREQVYNLSDPAPVKNQVELWLTIRIDFYEVGSEGKFLTSALKRFAFIPDETAPALYRITPK
jgi:hypothetical protein